MITIDTKHLKIGMYVCGLDRPWEETPFVFQGFPIKSEKQLLKLQELCQTVQIDEERSDNSIQFEFDGKKTTSSSSIVRFFKSWLGKKRPDRSAVYQHVEKPFEEEMSVARQLYVNTNVALKHILDDFRLGHDISAPELQSCVHGVIDGVMNNPNALALLSNLKSKQQDSVRHSVNICILSLLFGRYLGLEMEKLTELGYAALLHDVGEIKIPQTILDKHHRQLTPEEKKLLELHTVYGAEILRKNTKIPEIAAEVALSHHERIDGKGYPHGLKGAEIEFFAKLVAIIDVYETVTNNPAATIKISSSDALKSIYSLCDSYFERELVEEFIKCLGIYPIGSVVELNTQEIAIVIRLKPGKNLLPTVMIVIASEGIAYYPPKIVNLDHARNKDGTPQLFIAKVITPESVGIDLSDYLIREAGLGR
jgi:HD-GYP domain-containing protein (c-di-GMP phosphodiesterase class II)